jgi:hypothetical protein
VSAVGMESQKFPLQKQIQIKFNFFFVLAHANRKILADQIFAHKNSIQQI